MKKKPNSLPPAEPVGIADEKPSENGNATVNRKSQVKKTTEDNHYQPGTSDELDERELLKVLAEVRAGNFSVRMPIDQVGMTGKICDTLNEIISLNEALVEELTLARNTIGKQGHLNHRVELPRSARG